MESTMPFRRFRVNKFLSRLGFSSMVLLLFLLLGAAVIYAQTKANMHQDAEAKLLQGRERFDQIFNNLQHAATQVETGLGKPCLQVVQNLRDQVVFIPDVRSVSLAKNTTIYCSSIYGPISEQFYLNEFVDGQLELMSGNDVTPDRALMVYRQVRGDYSILVAVDGYYLRSILNLLSGDIALQLRVGDKWMDAAGMVHSGNPANRGEPLYLASEKYAYSLSTALSHQQYWAYAWQYSRGSLIFFILMSLGSAALVFWLSGRASSPTQVLKQALENNEFIPYMQPIVSGKGQCWVGCEVLMRWQHPGQGLIQPNHFIPMAEDSELIVPMTRAIMQQVSAKFAPYVNQLPEGFHFGFNISANHCRDLSLVDDCRHFIQAFGGNKINITLELTERKLIVTDEITDKLFAELHALGVFIAIDDFGTGHSSLSYLQKFKVDFLKIDQSFVGMIGSDALSSHIVGNVIDLATRLGLQTIAEGVENETQMRYLQAHNVDYLQGYMYGRPMPMNEFAKYLFH
ncbi:rtn protein [Yersinia kristensenii]|uniref:cyclic-guanylate-specific phosphodiesterase n=2 Tax=Yersinia kristensenii TaxID=28152 RepID=A0A0T9KVT4_YERKR|nr:rtn protein [Yersinia kristensenii]CND87061.1 rtn protein [Yersinia kristensenii]CNE34690.1 rtn protein [Yersinia kristensenii]CNG71817.1 rtn protein [Yersinia kristensenii]CNJ55389.1 rtn protein [Yersinia kristensenii]